MTETTSLLTVKMQPSSNWRTIVKSFCGVVFTLSVISFPHLALALNVKDVPNPKQSQNGWVTDMANVLSSETEADINRLLSNLEAVNGSEIAVVTVPETTPSATPKEFATALFNYWGIGKKGRDNGILLLIAKGDRRVEIETGYGVEDVLPDALVGNIINQKITPQFKQGNFDRGALDGTKALVTVLEGEVSNSTSPNPAINNPNPQINPKVENPLVNSNPQNLGSVEQNSQDDGGGGGGWWGGFMGLLALGGCTMAIFDMRRGSGGRRRGSGGRRRGSGDGDGGSSSGGGGGGGDWGGGSSGGGGAGGSW